MKFAAKALLLVSFAAMFASAQTLPHFQHIIIVIQENRTPDDLFGANLTFENGVDLAGGGTVSSSRTGTPITSSSRTPRGT
jgi:phospholipase C